MSAASARMQMDMRGRGTLGSLFARQHAKNCAERKNQLDSARETLVALRVIIFQADLELDRLDEIAALLASRVGKQLLDRAPHA